MNKLALAMIPLVCSCAALRQHAEQARTATVSVIEAPQRVESGATVTEALGAAVSTHREDSQTQHGTVNTQIDGNSVGLWIALFMLGLGQIGDLFAHVWNVIDRRRFHRHDAESKGIVR